MSTVQPGRYETLEIYSSSPTAGEKGSSAGSDNDPSLIPRFTLTVVDMGDRPVGYRPIRTCAVFFVPFGREAEYQFTSRAGLEAIAEQAQTKRLIVVRCNRPHTFPAMNELQSELSPVAMNLCPIDKPQDELIPYMAVEEESAWECIHEGVVSSAGHFMIEEKPSEDADNMVHRRLIFLQNQQFIQTEVRMCERDESSSNKSKGKGKGKGNKGKKKVSSSKTEFAENLKPTEELGFLLDPTYLDDHHRTMLISLALVGSQNGSSSISSLQHLERAHILHSSYRQPSQPSSEDKSCSALLVGLGGGSLVMAMQRYLPHLKIDIVEIVPELEEIATKYFGFVKRRDCRVFAGDGVEVIRRLKDDTLKPHNALTEIQHPDEQLAGEGEWLRSTYNAIILDVDSKDSSVGLTAPPADFITDEMLLCMWHILSPNGIIILNVVARDKTLISNIIHRVCTLYSIPEADNKQIFQISAFDSSHLNISFCILKSVCSIVVNGATVSNQNTASNSVKSHKKNAKAREDSRVQQDAANKSAGRALGRIVEQWLQAVGHGSDPLELVELAESGLQLL